ncbi:hypothetical protein JCM10450v2_004104 [Rhodotorula kratochvilovae]
MAPPKPANGDTQPNGASPSRSSSPEYDPAAFQASLDESVQETRSLVESWLPKELGKEWEDAFSQKKGTDGLQSLKDRARPPRLGLGAQPASLHKQQAEDRKLASRLLRGRTTALGDEGANVTPAPAEDAAASSSDDDEDSRSRAVGKGKARAASAVTGASAYANPFVMPSTSKKAAANGTPVKPAAPKQLFNDPSPVKPSPSAAASTSTARPAGLMAPIAASSAYAANGAPPQPLTKNQRKKERERLKKEEERRRREEESRAEAEREEGPGGAASARKRAREEEDSAGGEGAQEEEGDAQEDADVSMASAPPSPAKAEGAAGADSPGKKKRRKKKKKNGGQGGEDAAPLLNLAPLAKAD